jgi:sortase A
MECNSLHSSRSGDALCGGVGFVPPQAQLLMMKKKIGHWFEYALFATGVGLLIYVAMNYTFTAAYQFYLQRIFLADPPPPFKARVAIPSAEGSLIGKLEIPRLNASVMVLEGAEDPTLRMGAGHVPGTDLPGTTGNVAIAAHRDTFFRPLRKIQDNDLIRITTPDGVFDYAVEWTRIVTPTEIKVLDDTDEPSLTLITCYPFSYIGSAPDRFVVRGRLVSTT